VCNCIACKGNNGIDRMGAVGSDEYEWIMNRPGTHVFEGIFTYDLIGIMCKVLEKKWKILCTSETEQGDEEYDIFGIEGLEQLNYIEDTEHDGNWRIK